MPVVGTDRPTAQLLPDGIPDEQEGVPSDVFLQLFRHLCADNNMSRTSTFIEDKGFPEVFCYKSSKIRIRNKQNLIIFNLTAYLNCRRRRHTNITSVFSLGSRVDIRHNRMIRMLCLQFAQFSKAALPSGIPLKDLQAILFSPGSILYMSLP